MPNLGKPHVGDVRTLFQLIVEDTNTSDVNVAVDLATTTQQDIIISDPDDEETTLVGSISNPPGTDGQIEHLNTLSTLLDQAGYWKYRAKLTFSDGGIFESNDVIFEVLE